MESTPVGRYEWERLILRAELETATKLVALAAATYGNPDGSRVAPSVARLSAELAWSERHVQAQLSLLRSLGLLKVTRQHSRWENTCYRLTFPADLKTVPLRTDVDGFPVQGPRKAGRGGRKPKSTGTPVPVTDLENQNPSSGENESDRNSSSGHDGIQQNSGSGVEPAEDASTGTQVPVTERSPELEFPNTGTPVPQHRNSSSPDHLRPRETNPVVTNNPSPTSTQQDHNHVEANQPPATTQRAPVIPDPEAEFRAAHAAINDVPKATRAAALAEASAQLAGQGIVGAKPRIIRAAALLRRDTARHQANQEDRP